MDRIEKTDAEWRAELDPETYRIARQKGTEAPYSGEYCDTKTAGTYQCACCGADLFASDTKFESGSGWPSFWQPIDGEMVAEHADTTHGMRRVEVTCQRCGAHLGHVFPDGPKPTGQRYCINSAALALEPVADK